MSIRKLDNEEKRSFTVQMSEGEPVYTFQGTQAEEIMLGIVIDLYIQAGRPYGPSPNEALVWAKEGGLREEWEERCREAKTERESE